MMEMALSKALGYAEPKRFSRKEAAAFLASIGCPIAPSTLAHMASNNNAGRGPSFTRIRWRMVSYEEQDLRAWAAKQVVRVE